MSIATTLRNTPRVGIAIAAICLLIAAVILLRPSPPRGVAGVYYYDLASGDLIPAARGAPPAGMQPIVANVYTCDACEPSQWFVAWLEMIDSETGDHHVAAVPEAGAKPQWLPVAHNHASALMSHAQERCDAGKAAPCFPQAIP